MTIKPTFCILLVLERGTVELDAQVIIALAREGKERHARESEEFYREFRKKLAADKQRKAVPGQLTAEERNKRAEDAVAQLREMLDMSLEEQVATQMACITQSAVDCMVRASVNEGALPSDARQSAAMLNSSIRRVCTIPDRACWRR